MNLKTSGSYFIDSDPELALSDAGNRIARSMKPGTKFPSDEHRQLLQVMLEAAESFYSSLFPFKSCERDILIPSFQHLLWQKLSEIGIAGDISDFPKTVEELKLKTISQLNGVLPRFDAETLLLEICRVTFFQETPSNDLPFPICVRTHLSFAALKYNMNNEARPSPSALAKRIPIIEALLYSISDSDLMKRRRMGFAISFYNETFGSHPAADQRIFKEKIRKIFKDHLVKVYPHIRGIQLSAEEDDFEKDFRMEWRTLKTNPHINPTAHKILSTALPTALP